MFEQVSEHNLGETEFFKYLWRLRFRVLHELAGLLGKISPKQLNEHKIEQNLQRL